VSRDGGIWFVRPLEFNAPATPRIVKTLFCLLILAATLAANAQDTIALQSYIPTDEGVASGIVGWSFRPLTNVSVTALGCFDYIVSNAPEPMLIGLWAADGTLLASNGISTNSILIDQTRYAPIEPVLLSTNQTYYLGAFPTSGGMVIEAFAPEDGPGYASMAPEIQLNTAVYSTNVSFTFPESIGGPPDSAIFAPNFEFQDGIVPPVLNITLAGNDVLISWSATYTSCALQENGDLTTTNWMTATNSVAAVGGQNQVLISSPATNNFYRLISQ
jgi:hypothetical protein